MKNHEEPLVSVIIPVYNSESYICQCLDGLLTQTLEDIEIICINDGSTDNSLKLLRKYSAKDRRVKVISQQNGGAGRARNAALSLSSGKYLSILDSDDFFEPQMLERAYISAISTKADMVIYRADQYNESNDRFVQTSWTVKEDQVPAGRAFSAIEVKPNVFVAIEGWTWDKLFRRQFVCAHNLFFQEQRIYNDLLFTFSAYLLAKNISFVDEVLIHQRKRAAATSLSDTASTDWNCVFQALCALRMVLVKNGLYKAYERDFVSYALRLVFYQMSISGYQDELAIREAVANKWFDELNITSHSEEYFYSKSDWEAMQSLLIESSRKADLI